MHVTRIRASVQVGKARSDFNRLSGVYSDQLLSNSKLQAQYDALQTQYSDLLTAHQQLLLDYKALAERPTTP